MLNGNTGASKENVSGHFKIKSFLWLLIFFRCILCIQSLNRVLSKSQTTIGLAPSSSGSCFMGLGGDNSLFSIFFLWTLRLYTSSPQDHVSCFFRYGNQGTIEFDKLMSLLEKARRPALFSSHVRHGHLTVIFYRCHCTDN